MTPDNIELSTPFSGLSVVIPVYNSAEMLPGLVDRLGRVLEQVASAFEVILINDGSRDASWQIIKQLSRKHAWVVGIDFMRNYGQHNALLSGIRIARYPLIVTMDDDLQHPPEEIPTLLSGLDAGLDVVYGTPLHPQHGLWRDLASSVTKYALQSTMSAETASQVSAFRVFRTRVRDAFENYRGSSAAIDVLLTWGTTRFGAVPVRHEPRASGVSNYTFRKLVTHALNMVTGFSTVPLHLATIVGFAFILFGILVLIYVIGRYLITGGSVPGFPFLASIIVIFSGAQLFALGIFGEYLARMHFRLLDRPTYLIREKITSDNDIDHDISGTARAALRN